MTCGVFEMSITIVSWRARNNNGERRQIVKTKTKNNFKLFFLTTLK